MAEIGETLQNLRHQAGLTLEELSRKSGVSASEISRMQKGERNPSLGTVIHLVKGLEVPVEALSNKLRVVHYKSRHPREVDEFSRLPRDTQRLLLDIASLLERVKRGKA